MAKAWTNILALRWNALAARERVLVGSACLLALVALIWWIGVAPALAQIRQARALTPALDAQLQSMQAQSQEARSLKAQRVLSYDESLRGLEMSIKTLGAGATLSVNDARANVTLRAVSGDALAQWLAQVRANARLVPSELRIQKTAIAAPAPAPAPAAGAAVQWDGTIVLNLPTR